MVIVVQCAPLIAPYTLPQASYPHGGMGKAPEADESSRRGCNLRTLPQARETGWSAPKTLPPLTIAATLRP